MSALIGKFIDAIMDDDPKEEGRSQTKLKMHAIVNRKCQNLLTSVFASDRLKFQKLLMLRSESLKDIKAIKISQGIISVRKEGGWFNWATVTVPQVPNFWVFLDLVSRFTKVE